FDRAWNLVSANAAASVMVEEVDIDPSLLEPPVNLLRLGLHPRGLAPHVANLGRWRSHFLGRLAQQIAITGDAELSALLEELSGYPVDDYAARHDGEPTDVLGPFRVRAPGGAEWSLFGMFASFDT